MLSSYSPYCFSRPPPTSHVSKWRWVENTAEPSITSIGIHIFRFCYVVNDEPWWRVIFTWVCSSTEYIYIYLMSITNQSCKNALSSALWMCNEVWRSMDSATLTPMPIHRVVIWINWKASIGYVCGWGLTRLLAMAFWWTFCSIDE